MRDEQKSCLTKLNEIYLAGNLRVLAGAGASIQSGFPDWDTLNKGLLRDYLGERSGVFGPHLDDANSALLDSLTNDVYQRLGRDAIAEMVLSVSKSEKAFHDRVANALYRGRRAENLPLSNLQKQIAALTLPPNQSLPGGSSAKKEKPPGSTLAKIFTTNFDPLLAMALARTHKAVSRASRAVGSDPAMAFRSYRTPLGATGRQPSRGQPFVHHLHGWIDPGGEAGGQIVYAESHYLALQHNQKAPANTLARDLFGDTGATIILGMSLTDPNLRRLLFTRSSLPLKNAGNTTYLFTRRAAQESAAVYEEFWKSLGVELFLFEEYSELPHLLREIQWSGGTSENSEPGWFSAARALRNKPVNEEWFTATAPLLTILHRQVDSMYVTEPRERVRISLFSPSFETSQTEGPFIFEVGSVNPDGSIEAKSSAEWRKLVEKRRLTIQRNYVQGLAGSAFGRGIEREVNGQTSDGLDLNFSKELREVFDRGGFRDWRSLLAVPVLGGAFNLPVAVICIHSNFGRPFWKTLQAVESEYVDFLRLIRKGARDLLIPEDTN